MRSVLLLFVVYIVVYGEKEKVPHSPIKEKHVKSGHHNPDFDHQAILGSTKLEQEFDDLDAVEAKLRLNSFAKSHDTNKDGVITTDEMHQWIVKSFKSLDEEEALEKLEEDDENKDNQVTWREIVKKQFGYDLEDIADFKKAPEKNEKEMVEFLEMLDDEEARFNAADVNTDGFLEKTEYLAYMHPTEYAHMHETEIKKALKQNDKDKDGVISKQEFIGDIADKESRIVEEENFKSHDKNGDGKLDYDEIFAWIIQDNQKAAIEETEHLFNIADDNKDNELDMSEIDNHYDDFVGSHATDYGRHIGDEL